jgi:acyl-CoA synthetase (AMP-forming)/AMP-acid ligase II
MDAPTIPNMLARAVQAFPDNEFIVTPDRRLTFAAADEQSRRLAKRLLRAGIGKGTVVALLFPQGPDFVVTLLAITRIGAVAVPLSTFLRGPEIHRAVRHVDAHLLLAPGTMLDRDMQQVFEGVWPELATADPTQLFLTDVPYLRRVWLFGANDLDADDPTVPDAFVAQVESEVTPADRMVIVHTSGATAEPKAVVHTHGAQVRQAVKLAQLYELTSEARTFTTMPFFWVGGLVVSLLTHLYVGGAIISVERVDAGEMLDLIEASRPNRLSGWTLIERLRGHPTFHQRDLSWLADALTPTPGPRHNSLGMSETCGPHSGASASVNAGDLPDELQGSFGPVIEGMEHKIVDPATGATLPDGEEGEICVRGDSLMDGLYKRERQRVFDPDGWYRTGDGGFLRDGLLYFTGRLTEMIKTGGANVSPREVELAVMSLPGVQAAFVVGLPDASRGELVGCLVCPEEGHGLDADAITAGLADIMSSYKIPRRIMVLPYDQAPWLASGKISKPRVVELLTRA